METAVDQAAEPGPPGPLLADREQEDFAVDFGVDVVEAVCPVRLLAVAGVEKLYSERSSTYHTHFGVSQLLSGYGDVQTNQAAPEPHPAS